MYLLEEQHACSKGSILSETVALGSPFLCFFSFFFFLFNLFCLFCLFDDLEKREEKGSFS